MAARGVMAVWNDLEPGHEPEFEAWYRRQHVPERLRVPGFREARRYAAIEGGPRYCAFYGLDSIDVLQSPTYRERLAHPTRWTQRMMPRFRAMARTPCTVLRDAGAGLGASMSWIAAFDAGTALPDLLAAVDGSFAECLRDPGCVRLQFWQCDRGIADPGSPEARLRRGRDATADWIVCIEAADETAAARHASAIAHELEASAQVAARGKETTSQPSAGSAPRLQRSPVYRLLWRMSAEEAPAPAANEDWDAGAGAER